MNQLAQCRDVETLKRFLLGLCSESEATPLESHLLSCGECQETVRRISTHDDQVMTVLRESAPTAYPEDSHIRKLLAEISEQAAQATLNARINDPTQSQGSSSSTPQNQSMLRPAEAADEIGRLGSFRVLKRLGQGGMGIVFLAEDMHLKRQVALKVLSPSQTQAPEAVERFLREARAAAAVKHDHIVTIYQVGEDGSVPYIAMELLEGESLDDRLRRKAPLPTAEALRIACEAAAGLAAAHARGLLHRDIKPANIWLEASTGRVKILDFGLARNLTGDVQLTQSGALAGTPAYMSPEQIDSQPLDGRTDLFSLGCVTYRMLTGKLPFVGETLVKTLLAVAQATPPAIQSLNPNVSRDIVRLVDRLLAKSPQDRPITADEVVVELRRLIASERSQISDVVLALSTPLVGGDDRGRKRRRRSVAAGAGGFALVLLGIWFIIRDKDGIELARIKGPDGSSVSVTVDEKVATTTTPTAPPLTTAMASASPQIAVPAPASAQVDSPPPSAVAPFDAVQARAHQEVWAKHLGSTVETTNSIGMKLILIPPGEFLMGNSDANVATALRLAQGIQSFEHHKSRIEQAERPQHKVVITKPMWLGATEVTVAQFKQFAAATGYVTLAEKNKLKAETDTPVPSTKPAQMSNGDKVHYPTYLRYEYSDADEHDDDPASVLNWDDVQAFCKWLSEREKTVYRLPTEAEWEYACRAGTTTLFSFGDDAERLGDFAWYRASTKLGAPQTVGTKLPNHFGLFDMHGNVNEWCSDFFDEAGYLAIPVNDPRGAKTGTNRVLRGGTFYDEPVNCRSTRRSSVTSSTTSSSHGFRVVREVKTAATATALPAASASVTATDTLPTPKSVTQPSAPTPLWTLPAAVFPTTTTASINGLLANPQLVPGMRAWQVIPAAVPADMGIEWMSLSPDGKRLGVTIGAGYGYRLLVYRRTETGLELEASMPTQGGGSAWDPTSTRLVTSVTSPDKATELAILEIQGSTIVRSRRLTHPKTLIFEPYYGCGVSWSSDGHWVAASPYRLRSDTERKQRRSLLIWNAQSGDLAAELTFDKPVYDLAFEPDGTKLAYREFGGIVSVYDVPTKTRVFDEQQIELPPTTGLAWSHDGKRLFAGGASGGKDVRVGLRCLDAVTGKMLWQNRALYPSGYPNPAPMMLTPDGKRLVVRSGSYLGFADAATGEIDPNVKSKISKLPNYFASSLPGGEMILGDAHSGTLVLVDPDEASTTTLLNGGRIPKLLTWSDDGKRLAFAVDGGVAQIVTADGRLQITLPVNKGVVDLALSADGNTLAALEGKNLTLWNLNAESPKATTLVLPDSGRALDWAADGRIAVALQAGRISIFNPHDPTTPAAMITGPTQPALQVAWHPTGKQLAVVYGPQPGASPARSKTVFFDVEQKKQLVEFEETPTFEHGTWAIDGKSWIGESIWNIDGTKIKSALPIPRTAGSPYDSMLQSTSRAAMQRPNPLQLIHRGGGFSYDLRWFDQRFDQWIPIFSFLHSGNSPVRRPYDVRPTGESFAVYKGISQLECRSLDDARPLWQAMILPEGELAVFDPSGRVIDASPKAAEHLRVLIEEEDGRFTTLKPADFDARLKSTRK